MNHLIDIRLFNESHKSLSAEVKAIGIKFSERHQFCSASTIAQAVLELADVLKTAAP